MAEPVICIFIAKSSFNTVALTEEMVDAEGM
jgi:hypothetical protein